LKLRINSYAKINLGLKILNKRSDNYHNIHSIFAQINLSDIIIFSPAKKFSLSSNGPECSKMPLDKSNLISKSYQFIKNKNKTVPSEYSIHVIKNIPLGSGLGGGSSNAATVLKSLNKLWNLNYNSKNLENIASKIGADVPFFINGGLQLVEGIGDQLFLLDSTILKTYKFILVIPPIHISTSWAYTKLNKRLHTVNNHTKFSPLSKSRKWELFENDFEDVIHEAYPEISKIKDNLNRIGALYAGLSGSGSTVFGVFDNFQNIESNLKDFYPYQTFIAHPISD